MNHLKRLTLILLLIFSISSCSKSFLDVEDNTILLREQYVNDVNSLQQYLNGIYTILAMDFYNGGISYISYSDLIADNIKPTSTNTYLFPAHYVWNQSTGSSGSNTHMDMLWITGYKLIRSCNFTIDKAIEVREENPAIADQIQAEAYSIRALLHFVMVNVFAQQYNFTPNASHSGIPYVTSSDWNDPFTRNTVSEVYGGMIRDLTKAISLFKSSNNNTLVMNPNAAKALLARIYLFQENWQEAKKLAEEIAIAVPLLPTGSYPEKLFTRQETEALFQLAPSSTQAVQGSYTTSFVGFDYRYASFLATKDIADLLSMDSNDVRKNWIKSGGPSEDSIRKYPIDVVSGFGPDDVARSYYQTLLRSSEMFLTVAEAAAQIRDENTARKYLDAIRLRANPVASLTTATGAALLDSIYIERRKELAFEGFRMFDLLRWKKGVQRIDVANGAPQTLPYPSSKAIAPIPRNDVAYGISQNPDY